ncbi:type II toxin-antitoxin system prevent-host-death family antitoxin [Aliirhizobium terrae]|uniref:type II toxin-antitoxin system Phd/YefM family antitoxin n=1 Tax=Terrirhizobium terrae TaxID=2926709 RepID=UPI0025767C44|nr:type II toxin-antitoxin system prevent-host-death family antitoxin [Rhizobium sp. CC-CFT758]WJH40862.1 type II toxin-antitoxin system prevent-host-death family antitoxin [Rhizobium sp. CC-CFT758]
MEISVSDAKASLTELLHRAEAGEEVVLTRRGQKVAQIVPLRPALSSEQRRALIDEIRAMAPAPVLENVSAARSQDFLYGDDGLPK